MKIHQALALLAVSSSLSLSAIAHEDGAGKKPHEKSYDCEAVRKMDHSNMNMNDPHMQDMMKVCGAHGYTSENQHGHGKRDDKAGRPHNDGHGGYGRSGHQ